MRRSSLLIAATLLVVAAPSEAKQKWAQKAKDAQISCMTCHKSINPSVLNEVGEYAKKTMNKDGEPDFAKVAEQAKKATK